MLGFDIYNEDYEMFSIHKPRAISRQDPHETITDFKGKLLIREIVLFSGAYTGPYTKITLLAVMGRVMVPFIARMSDTGSFGNLQWDFLLYSILESGVIFYLSFANYIFILSGYVDFQRRKYQMKACSALLNPFKNEIELKYQIFPTINHTCKRSLQTWFEIRLCLMDLGRKYMTRIFLYSSTFLGVYFFYAIILLL